MPFSSTGGAVAQPENGMPWSANSAHRRRRRRLPGFRGVSRATRWRSRNDDSGRARRAGRRAARPVTQSRSTNQDVRRVAARPRASSRRKPRSGRACAAVRRRCRRGNGRWRRSCLASTRRRRSRGTRRSARPSSPDTRPATIGCRVLGSSGYGFRSGQLDAAVGGHCPGRRRIQLASRAVEGDPRRWRTTCPTSAPMTAAAAIFGLRRGAGSAVDSGAGGRVGRVVGVSVAARRGPAPGGAFDVVRPHRPAATGR